MRPLQPVIQVNRPLAIDVHACSDARGADERWLMAPELQHPATWFAAAEQLDNVFFACPDPDLQSKRGSTSPHTCRWMTRDSTIEARYGFDVPCTVPHFS